MDLHLRLSYLHPQIDLASAHKIQAKRTFDDYSRNHGIRIRHYHEDNRQFSDNSFLQESTTQGQKLYFSVSVHFQNIILEKNISYIKEQTRKQLHHAKSILSTAININLWPYALRQINDLRNIMTNK